MENNHIQDLTMDAIEESNKVYENLKDIFVNVESEDGVKPFRVQIYKVFSPTKIKECIQEYIEKLETLKKYHTDYMMDNKEIYLMFMLFKHFTTVKVSNHFYVQLKTIEMLFNNGVLLKVLSEFEVSEIEKIKSELDFVLENFENNYEEFLKIKDKYLSQVENKFLIEK